MVESTTAEYLGSSRTPDGHNLRFRSGNHFFEAELDRDRGGPPALELGSLVQVTGNLEPAGGPANPLSEEIGLEIFNPDDIVLIRAPSWWSWRRILWLCGGFLIAGIVAGVWITMILRKNRSLTVAKRDLQRANDELEQRVRDRTADLALANAEPQREQALFRTLLDTASDYICFKDLESRFVRCSVSMSNWRNLSNGEIVGKTNFDLFQEDQARAALAEEQEIIRTGQPLIGKIEKETQPNGRVTWMMTSKMPWREPDGKIIGTFGISRDITSIKEAEAELKRAQNQLLEASRAAGMADVATGVLHNVGNVLNSVNVSATLLTDQIKLSKVKLVGRAADLMKDHAANLGEFLTKDPHGQRMPQYLSELAEHLAREQAHALKELTGLQKNVDHIKEIVAMQQSYATVAGMKTIVNVTELIDDVLRLTEPGFERHGIKLAKEFDTRLPEISVDRHKVLQILINLIRNAKQACQTSSHPDKRLTVRATAAGGRLNISVIDNGVGIPKENLTRIFSHGFTTRKNGHGFGLHSSALAAKELGGALSVHSDGPGKGATFTLVLNLNRNN
jgi:PAS domain S-box-containing protein